MRKTAEKIPFSDLDLVKLEQSHDLSDFDCVVEEDDREALEFLQTTSMEYQNMDMAVTYLCRYQNRIVGFLTICTNSVEFSWEQLKDVDEKIRHKEIPALKIAWLGTHKDFRGRNIGKFMVFSAVDLALRLASTIGVRLVTLDTRDNLVEYYRNLGFKIINRETRQKEHPVMYFDLLKDNII